MHYEFTKFLKKQTKKQTKKPQPTGMVMLVTNPQELYLGRSLIVLSSPSNRKLSLEIFQDLTSAMKYMKQLSST